jgi:ribose transport system substrate-binding protein
MKKLVASLLPALILFGCSRDPEKPAGSASAPETRRPVFVMVPKGVAPYYEPCYAGFQAAARKYGVNTDYRASKELEVPQQVEIMEDLIARHVEGIAVSALDDQALVAAIAEAAKAGIKVVTFDAPAPSSQALTYIGTMNETAGYAAAERLASAMNGQGEVAVLQGGLGAPNLNQRFNGFARFIKEHAPNIQIVAREDEQGKMALTVNKTEALLEAHPNLKAIFGVSAEVCPGAAAALQQQGKAGKIILAGFDDLPDTVAGIKRGVISFCVAQRTYKMGWLAVEKLLDAVANRPLPKEIDTGVLIVSKDNVDSYLVEMKREFEP